LWVANHFPIFFQNSKQTRVAMWKIFDSGRNMYDVEEPS
jgi:hypothetical protein